MKDPAFLFYTKDFQSGTQDFTCEEVGAYLRLLMYQHQNKKIPNDKERLMRITGIFSEQKFDLVWETIGLKFNILVNHLVNERLNQEMNQRAIGKPKKIAAATFAGLISKSNLNKKNIFFLKKSFQILNFIYKNDELITDETIIKSMVREWFYKMVNQMVNNLADANADANVNVNEVENENENEKKINFPFETENFINQWNIWKDYKKTEFKFCFKSQRSEQASLTELSNLSNRNEKLAIDIIQQSIANGWKGFYELKNNTNTKNGTEQKLGRQTHETVKSNLSGW